MTKVVLPVISSEHYEELSFGVDRYTSRLENVLVRNRFDGKKYIENRPRLEQNLNSINNPTNPKWRGYYSEVSANFEYGVLGDEIWLGPDWSQQSSPAAGASALSNNPNRCYFAELNGNIFCIDPKGNLGKWINNSTPTTFYDMDLAAGNGGGTFTTFPPNNSKTLAPGIAELNRRLYVLTTDKEIWGSELNDGTTWSDGLNVITAERLDDRATLITTHHDNVVVFGSRSIQFFEDTANPVGSPLTARSDIFYNIGCVDPNNIWQKQDIIYFIGFDGISYSLYKLESFGLTKLGNEEIYLLFNRVQPSIDEGSDWMVSGMNIFNKDYIILSSYSVSGTTYIPGTNFSGTFVYDIEYNIVYKWDFDSADIVVVGSGLGSISLPMRLLLSTGGTLLIESSIDSSWPLDYDGSSNIAPTATIRLSSWSNNNHDWKFFHRVRLLMQEFANVDQTITVRWYDEDTSSNKSAAGSNTINPSDTGGKITRLGRAKSRAFEIEYTPTIAANADPLQLEGIELEFTEGTH